MGLTVGKVLLGAAVFAGSFGISLAILNYSSSPPSPAPPSAPVALPTPPSAPVAPPAPVWNEALYLAVNADVAAAVARKEFKSGREHYDLAGKAERRQGGFVPGDWNEAQYLKAQPDVAAAVTTGRFISGYHHYLAAGRREGRTGGFPPGRAPE